MKKILASLALLAATVPSIAQAADRVALCLDLARTEKEFAAKVASDGIQEAFLTYMADECFIPDRLALSRSEYRKSLEEARLKAGVAFKAGPNPDVQLTWTPSRVDVSNDGTLGYTWGRYEFVSRGKDGKTADSYGIYLTIWRRQADGKWRFVFDGSPELPQDPAALAKFLARPDLPVPGGR